MFIKKHYFIVLVLFVVLVGISACSGSSGPTETSTVRIAALPVLDTLPIYVAEEEGLFENHNVVIEVIPAGSAPKRDELISSGQADGMGLILLRVSDYGASGTGATAGTFIFSTAPRKPGPFTGGRKSRLLAPQQAAP